LKKSVPVSFFDRWQSGLCITGFAGGQNRREDDKIPNPDEMLQPGMSHMKQKQLNTTQMHGGTA